MLYEQLSHSQLASPALSEREGVSQHTNTLEVWATSHGTCFRILEVTSLFGPPETPLRERTTMESEAAWMEDDPVYLTATAYADIAEDLDEDAHEETPLSATASSFPGGGMKRKRLERVVTNPSMPLLKRATRAGHRPHVPNWLRSRTDPPMSSRGGAAVAAATVQAELGRKVYGDGAGVAGDAPADLRTAGDQDNNITKSSNRANYCYSKISINYVFFYIFFHFPWVSGFC
jgi:hypothetical protein